MMVCLFATTTNEYHRDSLPLVTKRTPLAARECPSVRPEWLTPLATLGNPYCHLEVLLVRRAAEGLAAGRSLGGHVRDSGGDGFELR